MNGWYVVYLIMMCAHGFCMADEGLSFKDAKYWVWLLIPVICYIAGSFK